MKLFLSNIFWKYPQIVLKYVQVIRILQIFFIKKWSKIEPIYYTLVIFILFFVNFSLINKSK